MNDLKGIIEDVEKSDLVSDKVIKKVIEIIGQEKWQDINDEKSDICTTTGELIITLKCIPELEKENAELKETLKTYNGCGDWDNDFHTCRVYLQHEELQEYIMQLEQAKEIITKIEKIFYSGENAVKRLSKISDILGQAEQYFKEIEK